VLSLVLGGVAGFAANAWGVGAEGSMLATFAGAITPWLWWSRRNRLAARNRN
jgi:outer membrane lipoprotein SlyB